MEFLINDAVQIEVEKHIILDGNLQIPEGAKSVVIFSHGSGSSRLSPRNQMVASYLHNYHIGTLLFDLLTREEDMDYGNRFNISLLTRRLVSVTHWLMALKELTGLKTGFFGASTGAASALNAAALLPEVGAVVSRGGRPDLSMDNLPLVKTPVLLIVGGRDYEVISLNRTAFEALHCEKRLEIVQGATHLFEEPGAMENVCALAAAWFKEHLHGKKSNIQLTMVKPE